MFVGTYPNHVVHGRAFAPVNASVSEVVSKRLIARSITLLALWLIQGGQRVRD